MAALPLRVAVAASGGRDSTALLHCTLRAAAPLGMAVVALHVHHGLMAAADDWLAHVRSQSRRWGAAFASRRLQGAPAAGDSMEGWARRGRYAALAEMAQAAGCSLVLLAHHRRDQAETWLLQALRAGGPAGLSAMPAIASRGGLVWARPWLDMPHDAIDAYVHRHRLRHMDDDSNADPRHARNRLRLHVWPALHAAFPYAEAALAGAARQAQESTALAAETASLDLPGLLEIGADGRGERGNAGLITARWLALPPARRRNALQHWLDHVLPDGVPRSLLDRLLDELPAAHSARWPAPGAELRLYRGVLRWSAVSTIVPPARLTADAVALDLSRPGDVALPGWGGSFRVEAVVSEGAAPAILRHAAVRRRVGGERFRAAPHAAPRSLKKQFQARSVPAWQRTAPLLFTADGRLLFVPGLGIDAALQAAPGAAQLGLRWLPD